MVGAEAKNIGIELKASVVSYINTAFHSNSVPATAGDEIVNDVEQNLTDASILVSSTPVLLKPRIFRLDRLRAQHRAVKPDPWQTRQNAHALVYAGANSAGLVGTNDCPPPAGLLNQAAGRKAGLLGRQRPLIRLKFRHALRHLMGAGSVAAC